MFYGRKTELSALSNEVAKPNAKAKVLVMTGRRRVGKSTLVPRDYANFNVEQTKFPKDNVVKLLF